MSFGFDDSWIDPPDDEYEAEEDEIILEFDHDKFYVNDGYVEFSDDFKFEDIYDDVTYTRLLDEQDLQEYLYLSIEDEWPEEDGEYELTGKLHIPYILWYPLDYKGRRIEYFDDDDGYKYTKPELEYNNKVIPELKITQL